MASALQSQLESLRLRAQASPAGAFARWWVGELRDMLPAPLRERLQHAQRKVVARVDGGELELFWQEGEALQQLEVFSLEQDTSVLRPQINDLLAKHELEEAPRVLVLPETGVLRKTLTLPLAAEANLRQALAFEMDRHTPFSADQVHFDYRIIDRDRERGQLHLELVVSPAPPLDDQVEQVTLHGLAPSAVDVALDGKPAELNLLPPERRRRVINQQTRLNLLLGAVVVLLLALVMAQSLWLREAQIESLEAAIEEVRVEARRVQNIRTQIEDASEAAGFMFARRAETPSTVRVLAEVTRLLPDDTYLDRLRVWDGNVQLQGKSDNAQRLIEMVNESPQFAGAGFRGSTRLDGATQKEVFDLNATVTPEGE
ncbi:MAG: PilN domain-containing protein [Xanthomonadales bacterium]|jgi:general secretion pathway protein L|nr:PilN domain-containing protein [Xanthomonadales bacterium]